MDEFSAGEIRVRAEGSGGLTCLIGTVTALLCQALAGSHESNLAVSGSHFTTLKLLPVRGALLDY